MILSFSIFTFNPGDEERAKKSLDEQISFMEKQPGLIKAFLAKALDNSGKFLVYSEWKSREEYEANGDKFRNANVHQGELEEFFDMMTEEPVFGSFNVD
jgi:heme-degrading monooxygenase HmoA